MSAEPDSISARFRGLLPPFALDIAFEAPMRGITALFGPSGSGKTTILRCLAGLRRMPGRLSVGGQVWQDDREGTFRKPYERAVGYVFQEPSLFPHLSVCGNLLYGRRRAKRRPAAHGPSLADAIDLLGLGPLMGRSPHSLSGGERQRVAVGRALLSQPRLLLMDEPLSALDREAKDEILPYLEALHASLAVPILYVSHDLREVARLADTLIVLSEGRQVCAGRIQEVLERLDLAPGTEEFEAGVVLDARVVAHDRAFCLTRLDHYGQAIAVPGIASQPGESVRLRIRARDVALATSRPAAISVRNILAGTVREIAEQPATAFAEALVDIGGARLRARITRDAVAHLGLAPGTPVFALVKSISLDRPAPGPARDR